MTAKTTQVVYIFYKLNFKKLIFFKRLTKNEILLKTYFKLKL